METNDKWRYAKVDINLIDEVDVNANEMTQEDFAQLTDNISKSGMSSVPACVKRKDGRYVTISGNHRLRACKTLHYKELGILYCDEEDISHDEMIAIELSHNSLHGTTNASIVKRLLESIQTIDFKRFAHVNVDEIKPVKVDAIDISVMSDTFVLSVILYPDTYEFLDSLFGDIREKAKKSDALILASALDNEKRLLDIQKGISDEYDLKSPNITFSKLLQLASERLKEIQNDNDLGNNH